MFFLQSIWNIRTRYYKTHPWQDAMIKQLYCSNSLRPFAKLCFKVSWKTSTLILWSPGLPGSRGITCKSDGFGRKPVGSENACHFLWARKSLESIIFLKTWWKPAGLAPSIAPGNEVSDLQGLQQKKSPSKSKFKPPPNLHKENTQKTKQDRLSFWKKNTPPKKQKKGCQKHEENSKHEKTGSWSKYPQIQ